MKRAFWGALALLCGLALFCLPAAARAELPDVSEPLEAFYAALPESLRDSLPPALLDGGMPNADALREAASLPALLARMRDVLADALPGAGRLLLRIALCLLFAAMLESVCDAVSAGSLGEMARFCCRLCLGGVLLEAQLAQLNLVTACLRQLQLVVNAMLPVLAAVLSAGGSTGTAAASCGALMLFLNLGENLCGSFFLPMIASAYGLAAAAWLSSGGRLGGLLRALKRIIAWSMGMFGTVFSAVFAFQTILAAGADSVAVRGIRFAVGSAVPVLGNVIGETVRTAATGLRYLKDTVGLMGILLLVLLVLPPMIGLFMHRAVLMLAESAAEVLGGDGERRLLGEFASVSGLLFGLLVGAVLCFIFALVLLVRISLGVGA
ncbi:MAG: hypothetical protein IKD37_01890 [Clostridia bacterium]|nr:hypothetical protein [Clostridia bacterium]